MHVSSLRHLLRVVTPIPSLTGIANLGTAAGILSRSRVRSQLAVCNVFGVGVEKTVRAPDARFGRFNFAIAGRSVRHQ
jgi:hypothetical protein